VVGLARRRAITYFISAIEFFVAMQFADLVVAIALVLAFGLRVVASIGASGGEDGRDRDADKKCVHAHD
jgi:hypothetical protein